MDSWATDLRILKLSILVLFTACLVKASATASRSNGEYKPVGPTEYRLLQPDLGKDDAPPLPPPVLQCLAALASIASFPTSPLAFVLLYPRLATVIPALPNAYPSSTILNSFTTYLL
ncbi:hypothetical protein Goari_023046 [Gossypium aridum]|uniref:Uncharacterized protein n=1 Tax=Gossypium aridum TaxID=34290 RepID=A0A7J8X1S5_GOSAI|nr:hypothetical protein [Gossypium aridum]